MTGPRIAPSIRGAEAVTDLRPSPRRDALHAVKRQVVIDAARRVFDAQGLDAATMRAIAAEAGCTTGAIYPFFRGKEELYAAVLAQSLEALRAAVERTMADETDPAKRAGAGLRAFHGFYAANPADLSLGLYLYGGVRPSGLPDPALNRDLNVRLVAVARAIETAMAEGGLDDVEAQAAGGIAQAVGLVILESSGRLGLLGQTGAALMERHIASLTGP
jgi:TetR/AcrR family transcriptional regulator